MLFVIIQEYRKYLEKTGVIDSLTKVLVGLYEEPERPGNAVDYVKRYIGNNSNVNNPANAANDNNGNMNRNNNYTMDIVSSLRKENEDLKGKVKDLEKIIARLKGNTKKDQV